MVSEAHERGLKVIPWTCDDAATIKALMDMGVDGIITNYPNHVRRDHGRARHAAAQGVPGPLIVVRVPKAGHLWWFRVPRLRREPVRIVATDGNASGVSDSV